MTDKNIGYGIPPKHSQFKKKQSGNMKGRPKGSKNRKTILKEVLGEKHKVKEGEKTVHRTTLELILLSIRNRMLEGNVKAFREGNKLMNRYAPLEPRHHGGYLVAPAPLSPEEWIEQQESQNLEIMAKGDVKGPT